MSASSASCYAPEVPARYPSDVDDAAWELIAPTLAAPSVGDGRASMPIG